MTRKGDICTTCARVDAANNNHEDQQTLNRKGLEGRTMYVKAAITSQAIDYRAREKI